MVLKHWERKRKAEDASPEPEPEAYPFVKFNVILDVPDFSPEEYERYLRCGDWRGMLKGDEH
jgi:hypothetical protein